MKYNSVPAYSFPKSKKDNFKENEIPGPGAYKWEHYKKKNSTKVIIKKSSSLKKQNFTIGPGSYNLNSKNKKCGFSFSKSKKINDLNKNVIGPGYYIKNNAKNNWKNGIIFKTRKKFKKKEQINPGPGSYENKVLSLKKNSQRIKIPKFDNKLKSENTITPGPGHYKIKLNKVFKKGICFKRFKEKIKNDFNIGPGSYDIKESFNNKGVKMYKAKRNLETNEKIPGPSYYKIKENIKKKGIKIFSAKKKENKFIIPGPGYYDLKSSSLDRKGIKINRQKKYLFDRNLTPGPKYQLNFSSLSKKGIFFKTQTCREKNNLNCIGPGEYYKEKKKKYKFPFFLTKKFNHKNEILPGPSDYKIKFNNLKKGIKLFKAKKNILQIKNDVNVGPGDYNIKSTIPDVAKYNYPDRRNLKIKL